MKRKTRFKIEVWPQLVLAAFNVVIMVIFLFLNAWEYAVWIGLFNYWILCSYFTERKNCRLREVAISLFNIINPTNKIGDEDWADFAIVEKDGEKTISVTVHRSAEKKTAPDASQTNNNEQD